MRHYKSPKKLKFKKFRKGRIKNKETKKTAYTLYYGFYGLKILKNARLNAQQLEATRRMISRHIRKKEHLWIRVWPDIPVTAKPKEIRMGKGKGPVDYWVTRLKAGKILFEWGRMPLIKAKMIFYSVAKKLPTPSVLIIKNY